VAILKKDAKVSIAGETSGWYHVTLMDGTSGWLKKELVDPVAAKPDAAKPAKQKAAALLYASKIRKTPEIVSGNVIETLFPGTSVQITGFKKDWFSIEYGPGKTGWIAQALVGTSTEAEAVAPVASSSQSARIGSTTLPAFISEKEINAYWQQKINELRKAKGLRELAVDQRFIGTASLWATHLGRIGTATHARPDGKTAQQWINGQGVTFTKRNSPDGWKTNYFSENLGVRLTVKPTIEGVKTALDSVLQSYLKEGASGAHYKSVYHPDWNSFGAGCYPIKNANGTYTMYFVFHYGSLAI
jgi:uncharacterized protein YkwD